MQNRVGIWGYPRPRRLHDIADRLFKGYATLAVRGALMVATDDLLIVGHNDRRKVGRTCRCCCRENELSDPQNRSRRWSVSRQPCRYL